MLGAGHRLAVESAVEGRTLLVFDVAADVPPDLLGTLARIPGVERVRAKGGLVATPTAVTLRRKSGEGVGQ